MSVLPGHTGSMKTAISMPDEVFDAVNGYAERHSMSRSEVFVTAARALLEREERDSITARIDAALARDPLTEDELRLIEELTAHSKRMAAEVEWEW